jgi:manganese/zinc/iron transport system substrate-binding protein
MCFVFHITQTFGTIRTGNSMKKITLAILILTFLLAACGSGNRASDVPLADRKINVVTTTGMIGDIVVNVGGDRVNVVSLMGPGVDPHLYKPTASDVTRLENADIVFYNGLHLEGRMVEVFEKMEAAGSATHAVAGEIDTDLLHESPQYEGQFDPHIWFDVTLWKFAVEKVTKELMALDPASREVYEANASAYLAQLDELDNYVRAQIASLPEESRVLVTAHDAFGYFGAQYGMEVRGLQGTSTASEAGAADVQNLAAFLVERRIKAIFVESSVPPATIEAVQKAAQARGWDVQIGGQLFSDAMGQPGTPEGTYIGMVRHNVDTIVSALK